ncbi:MFS transporter [Trinickia terrae]|uniref:MFS transporter n=1 Tax=Trinickia terrae TaxID=2571161 RepID=A0A4U1HN65_9BURK|nr:MFS transporter [Trinickia terrae]TKC80226.1 MFS transporter [Trinickia terrae]
MRTTSSDRLDDADGSAGTWLVPVGGAIALIVGNGPVSVFAFGVFMGPLQSEFGWSRASLSVATALCALVSALSLPFVGLLMDKFGVRRVLALGICLFGLNVAVIGQTSSLVWFIALTALTGAMGAAQSPIGYVKSIASHFDRRRGLAIGIAMSGIGLGTALVPQYVQWLIGTYNWRIGYLGLGAAIVVVAMPAVGLLLREPNVHRQSGRSSQGHGLSLRQAMALRAFWCIASAVLLVSIAVNGALVHVVPLLVDAGWTPSSAARVLAAAGVAGLAGRLLAGYLMDRVFAAYVASSFFAIAIAGLYLLGSHSNPVLGMVAIGLAAGAEVDMVGFFVSRYFGLKRFGQLYGVFFSIFTVGAGLGPLLLGAAFTRFHSYEIGFIGCGLALAIASVCILAVGPYSYGSPRDASAGASAV